jgi:hypothetical protein
VLPGSGDGLSFDGELTLEQIFQASRVYSLLKRGLISGQPDKDEAICFG